MISLLFVILVFWAMRIGSSVSVERASLLIESVQKGDLEVIIDGYGTLTSDKQQLITSFSSATVKEIVLKPGASVTANSVIVRLENPELQQQVENAEQELTQIKANLRQLKLNNQRETLNEYAQLAQIKASHETAVLKRTAEEQLAAKGIVSDLTFQQTLLDERQLRQRIEILEQRNDQLSLVHNESVNIQLERIKQQEGRLAIAQSRLEKLTVRAGFDGVLQRLSVELGQSLAAGSEVALIGSVTDLIALIRVPQSQAQQVVVGQKVIIDTRRDKIEGLVSRIDPIVDNNTVEIEVSLPENLPASARPQLTVDGKIIADTLLNVNYIRRPAGVKSNTRFEMYKLIPTGDTAVLTEVVFGSQAGQFMEVKSGANQAEQFIITDLSNLQSTNLTLTIN
ncbi:HlyD family efflux transporter periplasmic adaptor subunit [Psychrosphaera aquimarina]|uniref:HlyD family efflux transporter periplasmic adaptor subunit n=1 Tax=Psychrosphaera aquimarina TaxID=2044854 RepID=A0ABU3R3A1_9GAMM|nr:HlyD family efflux transporter periplasmic adaptor subunit [Psychrosphaera aquimarina]MDU0113783.1 HlyD family efflux transporter periplasmic adaptor subunit [Psychrosphaera aquimarina]